jgi:hypothetical protein
MRRPQHLIAAAILVALSGALAGCGGGLGNFDPTDMLDFLDTKKKLPGERKPVFPEGVPGLDQGVPKELYKGARQQQIDDPNAQAAAAPAPQEPRSKRGSNAKGKPAPATAAADPDAAPEEDASAAAPPPPKPAKIVRKRTTAPPPDQPAAPARAPQQSAAPFPAPMPSGTFTR